MNENFTQSYLIGIPAWGIFIAYSALLLSNMSMVGPVTFSFLLFFAALSGIWTKIKFYPNA